jgi:hypothetical protein
MFNTNNVNVNENMVLGLFYNVLSTAMCYVTLVRRDGDYNW